MANGMPTMNTAGMGELFTRLRFVFMALVVYRIGTHIPVPGIDPEQLAALFNQNQGTILGLANVFSGGALERMSILALGILPYISASIIMQLMTAVTPQLRAVEEGRRIWTSSYFTDDTLPDCASGAGTGHRYDRRPGESGLVF